MYKINIKPLSVNKLFRGRRFRTTEYDRYERDVILQLKPLKIHNGELKLIVRVGFSNKRADLDNCIKAFQDILQKYYFFDDSQIYRLDAEKTIVKKGFEFISFDIQPYEAPTPSQSPPNDTNSPKAYKHTTTTKTIAK